jgi:regulator of RNase E activity RraA
MTVGFRIKRRERQVDEETVRRFSTVPVANVSDSMQRVTAGGARIRPMHESGRMAGVALTVRSRPGDNLMLHLAINMARPGDVIVVDAGGDLTNALMGEMMLNAARHKGVAGIVIDGAIRDVEAFRSSLVPVYAAGVTHRGPYKNGPGEINVPVAIDGMVVFPGDLMIGDDDGVLAVGYDDTAEVLELAEALSEREVDLAAKLSVGPVDRTKWEVIAREIGLDIGAMTD